MRILGMQFNKIGGPDATRTYKVEFCVDESQAGSLKDFFDVKKGTEFVAFLYESNEEEIDDIANESESERRNRFMRRLYAMIHEISRNQNNDENEIKKAIKQYLIKKKYIVKSLSELDSKGLAVAIFHLQNDFFNN